MAEGTVSVELSLDEQNALRALTNLTKKFEEFGDEAKKQITKVDISFAAFAGNLAANTVSKAFGVISGVVSKSVDDFRQFTRVIAEINSTLPKTTKVTNDQSLALAKLSERFGTSATDQAKGFFEVVSNGVEDTATAFKILTNANNAALSGLVNINTAARLITSTFNAYSSQGVTAAQVTDTLVAVTQLSGVKFEELSQSMGRVTNVAAQSGVSFGELGGTIAFLNARSLTTEQAITGLASAITNISKPTAIARDEANRLGIEFNAAALQSKGLVGFLQEVTNKTKGNVASIRALFNDVQGANAVIAIASSQFDKYRETVEKATNSQGEAARAAKTIKESLDFKLTKAVNEFNALAISIGNFLIPVIENATKTLSLFRGILDSGNVSMDQNKAKLKLLADEYNKNSLQVVRLQNEIKSLNTIGAESGAKLAQESLNKVLERQNQILKERQSIRAAQTQEQPAQQPTGPEPTVSQDPEILKQKQEFYFKLAQLRAEFDFNQAQLNMENKLLTELQTQQDLENLISKEQQLINAKYQAEQEKIKLIVDSGLQQIAQQELTQRKANEIQQKELMREKSAVQAKIALERNFQMQKGQIMQQGFTLAATLAKDGSKTQFFIQKAGALAQVAVARGQAIASIPAQVAPIPFPANLAAAATLTTYANIQAALGAAIIAASAIKGYKDGGIVGGTSFNGDNVIAKVNSGEMILNRQQQTKLFNDINNGGNSGNVVQAINNLGDRIARMNIIVQANSREIARLVRDEREAGFAI